MTQMSHSKYIEKGYEGTLREQPNYRGLGMDPEDVWILSRDIVRRHAQRFALNTRGLRHVTLEWRWTSSH
jgi:hypothetical protein